MVKIWNSASKIVFILLAVTVCIGFFKGLLKEERFTQLASMAFVFYFSAKPTDTNGDITK